MTMSDDISMHWFVYEIRFRFWFKCKRRKKYIGVKNKKLNGKKQIVYRKKEWKNKAKNNNNSTVNIYKTKGDNWILDWYMLWI